MKKNAKRGLKKFIVLLMLFVIIASYVIQIIYGIGL